MFSQRSKRVVSAANDNALLLF